MEFDDKTLQNSSDESSAKENNETLPLDGKEPKEIEEAPKKANENSDNNKDSIVTSATVGTINDGNVNFAQTLNQYFQINESDTQKFFLEESNSSSIRFSRKSLRLLKQEELETVYKIKDFLADKSFFNQGIKKLKENGLLIIDGAPKLSLAKIGVILASQLKEEGTINEILYSETVNKQLRINFREDIGIANETFGRSILIFNNPLKKQNIDFADLIDSLNNQEGIGEINEFIQNLKSNQIYLIFTIEQDGSHLSKKASGSKFSIEALGPELKQREAYLINKLEELKETNKLTEGHLNFLNIQFNSNNEYFQEALNGLTSLSNIDIFIDQLGNLFGTDSSRIPASNDIKNIIRKSRDLSVWLIDELGQNISYWSFTLALGLLHNTPDVGEFGVSIIEFELFRNRLEYFLRSEQRIKREVKQWQAIVNEDALFDRCKAQKSRDTIDGKLYVGFKEEHIAEEIWQTLIHNLSLKSVNIIPFLFELIEEGFQAANAARILGRLGEIDPGQTLHWISNWSNSDKERQRIMVGYLFQGIHASGKESYIKPCEKLLEKYSVSNNHEQIWTAISAFKQIGLYKLDYALQQIGKIVLEKLVGPYEEISSLINKYSWSANKLQIFSSIKLGELKDLIGQSVELEHKAEELRNHEQIFKAVSYSISALCIMLEPLSVLTEWKKWLDMDNPTMKILFAKMLIPDGGVLSQLNRQISYYDEETDGYQDWHYMVLVISYGEKASKLILDLIQQVIEIFPLLPARESREMEDALVKYLANWAESSITTPNAMNEIVEFLGAVLANVPSLRKAFEAQIKAWTEDKRLRYKTLAAAVENHWVKEELALKQKKQVNISQWDI